MTFTGEIPVPGVRGLEHTADVGLEVEGADLPEIFLRGALGAMWLVLEREPMLEERVGAAGKDTEARGDHGSGMDSGAAGDGGAREGGTPLLRRKLELTEEDLPSLFRSWLRALLFWEETEGFVTTGATLAFLPVPLCSASDGQAFALQARVEGGTDRGPRIREIKGVTLHGLMLEQRGEGWYGRVIVDV